MNFKNPCLYVLCSDDKSNEVIQRCIDSIDYKIDTIVNMNSNDESHVERVKKISKDNNLHFVNTESQGNSFIGKVSCLRDFYKSDYDKMLIIDSDDEFYPGGINKILYDSNSDVTFGSCLPTMKNNLSNERTLFWFERMNKRVEVYTDKMDFMNKDQVKKILTKYSHLTVKLLSCSKKCFEIYEKNKNKYTLEPVLINEFILYSDMLDLDCKLIDLTQFQKYNYDSKGDSSGPSFYTPNNKEFKTYEELDLFLDKHLSPLKILFENVNNDFNFF